MNIDSEFNTLMTMVSHERSSDNGDLSFEDVMTMFPSERHMWHSLLTVAKDINGFDLYFNKEKTLFPWAVIVRKLFREYPQPELKPSEWGQYEDWKRCAFALDDPELTRDHLRKVVGLGEKYLVGVERLCGSLEMREMFDNVVYWELSNLVRTKRSLFDGWSEHLKKIPFDTLEYFSTAPPVVIQADTPLFHGTMDGSDEAWFNVGQPAAGTYFSLSPSFPTEPVYWDPGSRRGGLADVTSLLRRGKQRGAVLCYRARRPLRLLNAASIPVSSDWESCMSCPNFNPSAVTDINGFARRAFHIYDFLGPYAVFRHCVDSILAVLACLLGLDGYIGYADGGKSDETDKHTRFGHWESSCTLGGKVFNEVRLIATSKKDIKLGYHIPMEDDRFGDKDKTRDGARRTIINREIHSRTKRRMDDRKR